MLDFFRELAILVAAAEILGLLARKIHAPQVVGQIVAQKGLSLGKMDSVYFTTVILLILVSSVLTPVILSRLYKAEPAPKA